MCLAGQVVPLCRFLADRQQADARPFEAERDPREHDAHQGELQQVLRTAFDVGAGVEQHGGLPPRWNRGGQRWTIDAGDHPECEVGRQHRGAGVARAEECVRFVSRDQVCGNANGRAGLPARGCRRIGHLDHVRGFDDTDWKLAPVCVALESRHDRGG